MMTQPAVPVPLNLPIPNLTPPDILPDTEAWFWSPDWLAKECEANQDIQAGQVSQVFTNADDLIAELTRSI